jgi:hypothetical protein
MSNVVLDIKSQNSRLQEELFNFLNPISINDPLKLIDLNDNADGVANFFVEMIQSLIHFLQWKPFRNGI